MSVDMKPAVSLAIDYVRSLISNARDFRLEEVEQTKNGLGWLVTVSFLQIEDGKLTPALAEFLAGKRQYKQVEIDPSGQPIAMRIRKIE